MPEGFLLLNSRLSSNDVKEIRAALKAAYQRGREDAAKAVFHVIDEEHPRGIDWAQTRMYATLIAAARGDGEQA